MKLYTIILFYRQESEVFTFFVTIPKAIELYFFWHVVASSMLCLLFIYLNEKYRAFIRYFVQSRYMRSSKDQMVQKFIKVYFFKKNIFLWLSQVLVAM